MLRSLYGSTIPQGDTMHCPERLKLATSLHDGCLSAPSISSAAYVFILNLAELSLALSSRSSQFDDTIGENNTQSKNGRDGNKGTKR